MRHISILIAILSFAISANAAMFISVDGQSNPADTSVLLLPSETLSLGIISNGSSQGMYFLGITEFSPASLDIGSVIVPYPGEPPIEPYPVWDPIIPGLKLPIIEFDFFNPALPDVPLMGLLADNVILHADNYGDTLVMLYGWDDINLFVMDTQVIHQLPEPGTIALLGFGAMLLKRRR